jgi:hypothetical protein
MYDANHAHKSFRRTCDALSKEDKNLLHELKERLDNWLNHTFCSHDESDLCWKNTNNSTA